MPNDAFFANALRRARQAKARLSDMATQEVSVVDNAANLRRWLISKGLKGNDVADTKKQALRLPSEAKQGIMDGLAQALDKLTALATMIGEAEADDAATVPSDLGVAMKQCAELVMGLADQYAPAATGEGGKPAEAPAPAEVAEPTEMRAAEETDTAAKALPAPKKDGDNMTPMRDGDDIKPKMACVSAAYKAMSIELAATAKAGRKIKGERYQKLSELHDTLGKLLNELAYDEAQAAAEEKSQTKKNAGDSQLNAKMDELLALAQDNKKRLDEQGQQIAKMRTEPAESRVKEAVLAKSEDGGVKWPMDLSADIQARNKKK